MCSVLHLLRVLLGILIIFSLIYFNLFLSSLMLLISLIITKKSNQEANQFSPTPNNNNNKSLENTYSSSYYCSPALSSQISGLSCLQCLSLSSATILFTNPLIYLLSQPFHGNIIVKVISYLHIT